MKLSPSRTPTMPCVHCGYCCTKTPCLYGEWNSDRTRCDFLTEDNLCGKYDEIVAANPDTWTDYPAFGEGCCSPMNTLRRNLLKKHL